MQRCAKRALAYWATTVSTQSLLKLGPEASCLNLSVCRAVDVAKLCKP